jgi:recombinational DNA repair protein RecT
MLTKEENEMLTSVGRGTPGGELLRRYWMPIAAAGELTEAKPIKAARILGENLVVYRDKRRGQVAQWMPMVAGIRQKVRNSGEIATWEANVVHEKDQFDFMLGDEPRIHHVPHKGADRGDIVAAYSIATLRSGEKSREVMWIDEIEAVRAGSRAKDSGPWVTHFGEMAKKTVTKRHAKVLPMSSDLDDLLRRDEDDRRLYERTKRELATQGWEYMQQYADAKSTEVKAKADAKGKARDLVDAEKLALDWSPEQISGWLKRAFPTDESLRVSHETIYRSLFVQARGVLKKELIGHLRAGRRMRYPKGGTTPSRLSGQIIDAISIRERPAEIEDRAVPGHWEGDLLGPTTRIWPPSWSAILASRC